MFQGNPVSSGMEVVALQDGGPHISTWSTFDLKADDLDCRADSLELADLLTAKGYDLTTHESTDGAGWGMWRATTDRILKTFFPR